MSFLRLRAPSVRLVLLGSALILAGRSPTLAQDADPAVPPAYVSFVEGDAMIAHEGQFEPALVNTPIVEGDRIRTRTGRVQVMFPDATSITIKPQSDVVFLTATRVSVLSGSIERHDAAMTDRIYAADLPQELQRYGRTFARYGSWQHEVPYGRVWLPRVASSWRPYSEGRWTPLRSYGWTWVGVDAWSWPTHHYGRWGYARGSWFWVPARAWAPAWVSWGAAPGYVTWCPLGINGSPVFALSIGHGNPWTGWTVVRRDRFGDRRLDVRHASVDPRHLTRETPFILQARAPVALAMPGTVPLPVIRNTRPVSASPAVTAAPAPSAPPATGGVIAVGPEPTLPSASAPAPNRTPVPPAAPPTRAMERVPAPARLPDNWWPGARPSAARLPDSRGPAIPPAATSRPYAVPRDLAPATPRSEPAAPTPSVVPQPGGSTSAPIPSIERQGRAPAAADRASAMERSPTRERASTAPPPHARSAPPRDATAPSAPAAVSRPDTATDRGRPAAGGVIVKRPG